jgi:hypothetical protein
VVQHNEHPTTEQLSAFLDGQLSPDEQSQWDVHIKTCEQCQQELADLRLTVKLLRALPQPELPRSFTLPVDAPVTPIAAYSASRAERGTAQRRRAWPVALRTAARSFCAIAAVLGIFLLASVLLTARPQMGATVSRSNPSSVSSGSSASSGSVNAPAAATPQAATHKQTAETPEITPTASSAMGPYAVTPASPHQSGQASPPANPLQPVLAFFDVSTAGGRAMLGLLLLVLGIVGFILLRLRPKERAP